ncbi:MAG TPA: hypothetical protein VE871_20110 [Longimicrobium sp.]|nr:hypothetical protein [Longimicrobium sp.]
MDPTGPQFAFARVMSEALLGPDRHDRIVAVEETGFRLRFDPEPGVNMTIEGVEAPNETRSTVYHPTDERPASYPPEVPFLPGVAASVMGRDGSASVQWWGVPDVEDAVTALRAQCAADGWVEGAETGLDFLPGFRTLNFERADGGQRTILVVPTGNGTMIQLV